MKYLQIPNPQTLIVNGQPHEYGLENLNAEFVWVAQVWRANAANVDLFFEVKEKFDNAKPGDVVALTDEAFEIYSPLATLQGKDLQASAAVNELMALIRSVLRATSTAPEKETEK